MMSSFRNPRMDWMIRCKYVFVQMEYLSNRYLSSVDSVR